MSEHRKSRLGAALAAAFIWCVLGCSARSGVGAPCNDDVGCRSSLSCCSGACTSPGDPDLCAEACARIHQCGSGAAAVDPTSERLSECRNDCRSQPCARDDDYAGCIVGAPDCDGIDNCRKGVGFSNDPERPL